MEKLDYNLEPVEFCTLCLSLSIREVNNLPYCDKCGSTSTKISDIYTWLDMYKSMYGINYIK